jgi:hypothetical protein
MAAHTHPYDAVSQRHVQHGTWHVACTMAWGPTPLHVASGTGHVATRVATTAEMAAHTHIRTTRPLPNQPRE